MSNTLNVDDLKLLTAKFQDESLGVKVQSVTKAKDKALLVLYIQHTDAYARIEQVDPAWSCMVLREENGADWTTVRMRMTVKGVSRENTGEGQDLKSAYSDALKRCAMLFGVGRYLYASESVWVPYNEKEDYYRKWTMADYQRSSRPAPKIPAPSPVKPREIASNPFVNPPARSRQALGTEIFKTVKALNLTDEQLGDWTHELYQKLPKDLTLEEMESFLAKLMHEAGRAGVAV